MDTLSFEVDTERRECLYCPGYVGSVDGYLGRNATVVKPGVSKRTSLDDFPILTSVKNIFGNF